MGGRGVSRLRGKCKIEYYGKNNDRNGDTQILSCLSWFSYCRNGYIIKPHTRQNSYAYGASGVSCKNTERTLPVNKGHFFKIFSYFSSSLSSSILNPSSFLSSSMVGKWSTPDNAYKPKRVWFYYLFMIRYQNLVQDLFCSLSVSAWKKSNVRGPTACCDASCGRLGLSYFYPTW